MQSVLIYFKLLAWLGKMFKNPWEKTKVGPSILLPKTAQSAVDVQCRTTVDPLLTREGIEQQS